MSPRLTKTDILSRLQCRRRLWLEKHQPDAARSSRSAQRFMDIGRRVNNRMHDLFPGGILVEPRLTSEEALAFTAQCLQIDPPRPLFEAAFRSNGLLIRSDLLLHEAGKITHLIEVKSSTEVKPHHLDDCAMQSWVLAENGLPPARISLAHIDRRFTYAGNGDYQGLFCLEDVTNRVHGLAQRVPEWIADCHDLLEGGEPDIPMGKHCRDPYPCPFTRHCRKRGVAFPVESLPRAGVDLIEQLHAEGCHDIRDIPYGRLENPTHEWIRQVTIQGAPDLKPGLIASLRRLPYPRCYIDFETIQFAIPRWRGTSPYEQLPFQWSCHIEQSDGEMTHREFLDLSGRPPMRAFAQSLIDTLQGNGPVLVYSHFERTVLSRLADRYPELAADLRQIIAREYDLLQAVRAGYYHPAMLGSWSIKTLLPLVSADPGYAALDEVNDGISAQIGFEEAIDPAISPQRKNGLEKALLDYCALDTRAMVELVHAFSAGRDGAATTRTSG